MPFRKLEACFLQRKSSIVLTFIKYGSNLCFCKSLIHVTKKRFAGLITIQTCYLYRSLKSLVFWLRKSLWNLLPSFPNFSKFVITVENVLRKKFDFLKKILDYDAKKLGLAAENWARMPNGIPEVGYNTLLFSINSLNMKEHGLKT